MALQHLQGTALLMSATRRSGDGLAPTRPSTCDFALASTSPFTRIPACPVRARRPTTARHTSTHPHHASLFPILNAIIVHRSCMSVVAFDILDKHARTGPTVN